jgi:hypothetical protein
MIAGQTKETVNNAKAGMHPRRKTAMTRCHQPEVRQALRKVAKIKSAAAAVRRDMSVQNVLMKKQSRRKIGMFANPAECTS